MGASNQILGLRDRKKIQTRETIRREAMRLIKENGYANTTVEQIAEAAEVSPSTFFRYFPSKEMVLMANDLDRVTIEALGQQPADMPSLQAFRRALEITMATRLGGRVAVRTGPAEDWCSRSRNSRPRSSTSIAAPLRGSPRPIAARTGREPDDFEVRVFVGALAGGLMAVLDRTSGVPERMFRALDFMEAGMPLGATKNDS